MTGWLIGPAISLFVSDAAEGEGPPDANAILEGLYSHLNAHRYSEEPLLRLFGLPIYWTNHGLALVVASALTLLLFDWLALSLRRHGRPLGPLLNLLESGVLFVRDEMIYANLGKEVGRRFAPLFLSQFFVILFMNLFGILPNFDLARNLHFPTTATANVAVTAGLALVTLSMILLQGMREQGVVGYWTGLVPHVELGDGAAMKLLKVAIIGILIPIELLGLIIKPLALTIRLGANMTGGHLAMLTIYGLIYVFGSYLLLPVGVAFNVFLTFLELLVALIQAYIFTFLSILFVGAAVHPEH